MSDEQETLVWVQGLAEGDRPICLLLETEVEVDGDPVPLSSVPEMGRFYLPMMTLETREHLVACRRLAPSEYPAKDFSSDRVLTFIIRGEGSDSPTLVRDLASMVATMGFGQEVEIQDGEETLLVLPLEEVLDSEGTDPPVDVGAWVEGKLGALRIAEELGGGKGGFSVFFARMYLERWLADPRGVSEDLRLLSGHVVDEHVRRASQKKPSPSVELETYKEVVALLDRMPSGVTVGSQSVNAAQTYLRSWLSDPKSLTYDTLAMCRNVVEDYLSQEGL